MEGDNSAMAHFCGAVSQLQRCADGTFRIDLLSRRTKRSRGLEADTESFRQTGGGCRSGQRLKFLPACPVFSQSVQLMADSTNYDEQCNRASST